MRTRLLQRSAVTRGVFMSQNQRCSGDPVLAMFTVQNLLAGLSTHYASGPHTPSFFHRKYYSDHCVRGKPPPAHLKALILQSPNEFSDYHTTQPNVVSSSGFTSATAPTSKLHGRQVHSRSSYKDRHRYKALRLW